MWRMSSLLPWGGAVALFMAGWSATVVNDRSNGQVVDCSSLSPDQCGLREDCRVIAGRRVVLEKTCLAAEENVGCSDGACSDGAITYAHAPNGDYWQFSDGCTPKGWDELEALPQTVKAAVDRGTCQ